MTTLSLMDLFGQRCFIVASTGGHLAQAVKWADRLELHHSSTFLTFRSPQSESLLRDRSVIYTEYISPRDYKGVLRAARELLSSKQLADSSAILSTGAGLALAAVPAAVIRRKPYAYIESVSRFLGPSSTGQAIAYSGVATCFTQHVSWARGRWRYAGTLLSNYRVDESSLAHSKGLRIFITLGTIAPYRFDHLVDAVLAALHPSDEVVWQLRATDREHLPGQVSTFLTSRDFESRLQWADVVVTHAGVGTLLSLLDRGIRPVVMARRAARAEHVDDHQSQVAEYLANLGLIHLVEDDIARTILESPGTVVAEDNR